MPYLHYVFVHSIHIMDGFLDSGRFLDSSRNLRKLNMISCSGSIFWINIMLPGQITKLSKKFLG